MRVRLKVCCIASAREARLAVRFGADAVGLVAAMPSGPGPIPDHDIAAISREVPPPVARFLLTSETEPDAVLAHVTACGTDTVQLVDRVPDATHRALRERLPGVRVVQVIHVEDDTALAEAARVAPMVHALLLDSGRPSHPTRELGGTGRAHDWRISRTIVDLVDRPVFLAGGLTRHNVAEAIRVVRPYGIDLCGGVRTAGMLDPEKLRGFIGAMAE
jgi:phosphoribosylanthranilate isomerase